MERDRDGVEDVEGVSVIACCVVLHLDPVFVW